MKTHYIGALKFAEFPDHISIDNVCIELWIRWIVVVIIYLRNASLHGDHVVKNKGVNRGGMGDTSPPPFFGQGDAYIIIPLPLLLRKIEIKMPK